MSDMMISAVFAIGMTAFLYIAWRMAEWLWRENMEMEAALDSFQQLLDEMRARMNGPCQAEQHNDQMHCRLCGLTWDVNDPNAPPCERPDDEMTHAG